jgi:hypothetical protein
MTSVALSLCSKPIEMNVITKFLTNNKACLRILSVLLMKVNRNWDLRVMFSFVTRD